MARIPDKASSFRSSRSSIKDSIFRIILADSMDADVAEGEAEQLPYPRDLLRRLAGRSCTDSSSFSETASGEKDLRLELSLGVEPRSDRLARSSSIAALSIFPTEKDFPLARTCSLPVEAGEENRKRKETQSAKRLEAKRKREEKRTAGLRRSSSTNFESIMEEMPCVSTKGDGPNGRRIEGFLYRYKKGEDLRIVCVCHGSFLTPAEFIKHAGGGNVDHPLRHIVVNPSSS